jgi:hypothetical protein
VANNSLDTKSIVGTEYQDDSYLVIIEEEMPEVLPYLNDNKYCKLDSDCTGKGSFCSFGSYNEFIPFRTYGCTGFSVEGYSVEEIQKMEEGCEGYIKPKIEKYSCINNKCVTEKVTFECKKLD